MKNKILLISIIAAVLVAGSALLAWWRAATQPSDQAFRDDVAAIIKSGDLAACDSANRILDGVNYRTVCRNNIFWNEAQSNLDFTACEGLDDRLMSVKDCETSVMVGLLRKEKSLSVCNTVPDALKAACPSAYWSLAAVDQDNVTLCRNLPSSTEPNCERNFLISLSAAGASSSIALPCADFTEARLRSECGALQEKNCAAIADPLLKAACFRTP
jgi:hypothetical protein